MREWKDTFRFSLSLQMIGMVLLLVLCSMLLLKAYAGVVRSSQRSDALSKSVQYSRSLAEIFLADPEGDPFEGRTSWYLDEDLQPCPEDKAFLCVFISDNVENTVTGQIRTLTIRSEHVSDAGREEIYALSVDAFTSKEGR